MNTSARVSYEQVEEARKLAESASYAGSPLMERELAAEYKRLLDIYANQKDEEVIPSIGEFCNGTPIVFTCWLCGTHGFWQSHHSPTGWACCECNEWPAYIRGKCVE